MNIIVLIGIVICFIISIIFTIYLRFPQIEVLSKIKRVFSGTDNHAFIVTLGTNIGTGNLVGITSGIAVGGPGTIFWMWIFAFFSCSLSFAENAYAVKYQAKIDNEMRGGACFYILKGLNSRLLSLIFAVCLLITNTILFPPIQINTLTNCTSEFFNLNKYFVGIMLFIILAIITFRGTRIIIKVQDKLVPMMSLAFLFVCLFLMIVNVNKLGNAVEEILKSALSFKSAGLGLLINTILVGFKRSLFSNEAGLGTTPSVSGISKQNSLKSGYIQMIVVYIDTLIMCTITGIIIVMSGLETNLLATPYAIINLFTNYFSEAGSLIGYLFILVFAASSVIGQFYLGESNILFISTIFKIKPVILKGIYRVIYSIGIIIGVCANFIETIELLDIGMIVLGMINIFTIIALEKRYKYLHKILKDDIIE